MSKMVVVFVNNTDKADQLVDQTAIRVAETVLEMEDAVVEENVSIKRKNTYTKAKNDKIKKLSTEEQVSPAFGPAVDAPGLQDGQVMVETHYHYSLSKIRSFLKNTKGMRFVQAGDYFPDLQLFQESARHLMRAGSLGEPSFNDQEIYRLKKLLQKVWSRLEGADLASHVPSVLTCSLIMADIRETHSTLDNEPDWRREWAGQLFLSHRSSNSGGVGILFSRDFVPLSSAVEEPVPVHPQCQQGHGPSMRDLEREVVELQLLAESTGKREHIQLLKSKSSALAELLGVAAQGALVRSRFQHTAQMDAPSHFFFGLERKNGQRRMIHSLRANNGQVLEDPIEIRQRAVTYYRDLYRTECQGGSGVERFFLNGLPQDTGGYGGFLLGPSALDTTECPFSAEGGGRTWLGPPGEQRSDFQAPVCPKDAVWSIRSGLETCGSSRAEAMWYGSCYNSTFWLLEEPVVYGARFRCEAGLQLAQKMREAGVFTLGQLVNVCGPRLDNATTLAWHTGVKSVRVLNQMLGGWRHQLAASELERVSEFCTGQKPTNRNDPFPDMRLTPVLGDVPGSQPLLRNVQPV
ncbi:Transposon TX1 uncharacterized 149 kDa protein ORF 2 [Takifugu flavidus]|uniref:Transposon TX1 uncharacterized 149 kDa protein ORF 2 n=1 Tax=Takifugu flavidus TaxID=433684 RepID=A0A5C6PEY6_9TELE|nr:Transposon TX1 uncharacterized 149 kDa protein ORF 2 [Takifugu flavidus]